MHGDTTDRLQQENNSRENEGYGLLARASAFAGEVLESIQKAAGTTTCKGVQIARLKNWAKENNCWIDNPTVLGVFSDRGSENEVYMAYDGIYVFKLNDFRYSDDNLTPFFDRITAHNQYFMDCAYEFTGFSQNKEGKTCAVLRQQLVVNAREATPEEIQKEFGRLGFHPEVGGEYFTNGIHDIFDAVPNNVLVGDDGNYYFIDTIIFKSDTDGLNTYKKYSPNYSKSHQQGAVLTSACKA